MSIILLPIVWVLGHFVAITTMPEKDYHYLLPMFSQDSSALIEGTIIFLGASMDILILLLLQQHLKKHFSYLNIIILSALLMGLTLGPTFGSIASFGPNVAAQLRFPAFEQWRLAMLGEHFSHLDFMAVFQLFCGVVLRVSLFLFLIYDMVEKPEVIKKSIFVFYAFTLGLITVIPISDIWVQTALRFYFYPAAFTFGITTTIVLFIISYMPQKKGVERDL